MRKGILCAGNWIVDLIKIIDIWPNEGMLANIISESMCGGGAPHNVLVNLAKMDSKLPLFASGLIGKDKFGEYLKSVLDLNNIDRKYLFETSEESTSFTDVMTDQSSGNRTFFHKRGTNALLDIKHFNDIESNAKIFHLGYLMLLDKLDSKHLEDGTKAAHLFKSMKKKGFTTSADLVSVDIGNYSEIILPSLKYIDYLIINEIEAAKCSNIKTRSNSQLSHTGLSEAASFLLEQGVNKLVVIHSPEGGFAKFKNGEPIFVPSKKLSSDSIKGSVGAGDAFCAGMLYGLHQDFSVKQTLKIANRSAWFNLQNETSTGGAVSIINYQLSINN